MPHMSVILVIRLLCKLRSL